MRGRWLRRLGIVYAAALAWYLVAGALAAAANAATGHATITNYLDVPRAYVVAVIAGNLVPYIAQLATRKPGWWTGAVTVALSLLDAIIAALTTAGDDNWKQVVAAAAVTWLVARAHLNTFIKSRPDAPSEVERWLVIHGNRPRTHRA